MTTYIAIEPERVIPIEDAWVHVWQGLRNSGLDFSRTAIVSTDKSRKLGRAGKITEYLDKSANDITVTSVFPALGTHKPHSKKDNTKFFGSIDQRLIRVHNAKKDTEELGVVPDSLVKEWSGGDSSLWHADIPVGINGEFYRGLKSRTYSAAISIGPVFPHEVSGCSNGLKNILVGLGSKDFIDYSHYLGATYGMRRTLGKLDTPVRRVFNYAHENFLQDLPIVYVLTVLDKEGGIRGIYVGDDLETHAKAAELSKKLNVDLVAPQKHIVVNLHPDEFTSTWTSNKMIYRTCMAVEGTVLGIAPGLCSYDDDPEAHKERDELIGKYGYRGLDYVLKAVESDERLAANLSIAAHLIHGSPDNFNVVYATDPKFKDAVEKVGFKWMDVNEAREKYKPDSCSYGMNRRRGESFFYVPDPSNVLLSTKENWKG